MIIDFLNKNKDVSSAFQEEYLRKDGTVDQAYVAKKYGRVWSKQQAVIDLHAVFGKTKFEVQENLNEVEFEEFLDHYEFGKYPNVRTWISYFNQNLNKLLTREKLFDYITAGHRDTKTSTR